MKFRAPEYAIVGLVIIAAVLWYFVSLLELVP